MILNSLDRSRMIYGSQTCLKTIQPNKLRSTYRGYLRKMTKGGYRRKEGSWSYVIYKRKSPQNVWHSRNQRIFQRQQKKYVAHLVRKPNSCIMKQLLFNGNKSRVINHASDAVLQNKQCLADDLFKEVLERKY